MVRNKNYTPWLFLLPALLAFTLFKYYPILLGFFTSFFKFSLVNPPGEFIWFNNYIRAMKDPSFYKSIRNTGEFFFIVMAINFFVPVFLAVLVNEVRKGKTLFRTMYFIPALAPVMGIIVLWKYIWQPDYGFANTILAWFNLPPQMWLNDVKLVKWCMQFPGLIMGGGMNLVIYLAALQDIPNEHFESALIDGANFRQKIRYISLPQLMPIMKIMFILALIATFNLADVPLIMTGGGPVRATETLVLYAFRKAYTDGDYAYAITLSMISFFVTFGLVGLQMKLSEKKDKNEGRA